MRHGGTGQGRGCKLMTPAERQRRCRDRKRRGLYLVHNLIGLNMIDLLIDEGYLAMHQSEDRACIQTAFAAWSEDMANEHAA